MTDTQRADYLARCRQSGLDDEGAQDFLEREVERRNADDLTNRLCVALRTRFNAA